MAAVGLLLLTERCIFLKHQKANAVNTVEIVGNHSDTSSENDVIHIPTAGGQYEIIQTQSTAQRLETQQLHNDDCHAYDEVDTYFLQEAHARVPLVKNHTPTVYTIIELSSTQKPAVEEPAYDNASV
ncbi:hypothetical protein MAR_003764 [Mya arenaria]|uniref:Uncharacterized protein n=1 Tax=Mya arenaria TaxID=6604 RepID=A0ABY7GB51_MYAAR|nr:hypothetical protein MAR_003764 [Mya arenaria]